MNDVPVYTDYRQHERKNKSGSSENSVVRVFVDSNDNFIEESIYLTDSVPSTNTKNRNVNTPKSANSVVRLIVNSKDNTKDNITPLNFVERSVSTTINPVYSCKSGSSSSDTQVSTNSNITFLEDTTINLFQKRIQDEMNIRIFLANQHKSEKLLVRPIYTNKLFTNLFSKGLQHDEDGLVSYEEMIKLITAIQNRSISKLSQVKLAGTLKLANLSTTWSTNLIGSSNSTYRYSLPPELSSDILAYDMCELYCMSLTRDIEFINYSSNFLIDDCCRSLNSLNNYFKTSPYNIFRGTNYQGPYISQFLLKQKYNINLSGDYMKTWETTMSAQNGKILETIIDVTTTYKYILTGRDLAKVVVNPLQIFFDTCDILIDMQVPMNISSDIEDISNIFDIKYVLSTVCQNSLLASSYVKWNTMFLRPEALSIIIERTYKTGNNIALISHELLRNNILETVNFINGNLLLTQVFPEGCPCSPSSCSTYSTISGACVTVLKFFFNLDYLVDVYDLDRETEELINTNKKVSVEDEINKLAFNIGNSRKWSGVSYNRDVISGLKRGEKVAISCLRDIVHTYPHIVTIKIKRFNGKYVEISNK